MIRTQEKISLELSQDQKSLTVYYPQNTDRTIYDVCDLNGRILKTGDICGNQATIDLSDLDSRIYIFLVLDGDTMKSRKFCLKA
ncbi:MAG TPA: T9SS type A sorting domain-containing protein [Cryomorphaceae bacterium]|nr:T9SS type A sorting domain-containing protein [Cryomorphaceae bacterium]